RGARAAADLAGHRAPAVRRPGARARRRLVRRGDRLPAVRRGLPGGVTLRDVIVIWLVGAGIAIQVFACLGVVLMRDALDRLHYVGAAAGGVPCVCAERIAAE